MKVKMEEEIQTNVAELDTIKASISTMQVSYEKMSASKTQFTEDI